jgi:carboxyl-terminal processing protease
MPRLNEEPQMTRRRWPRRILIAGLSLLALGLLGWGALFIPAVYFRAAFLLIQRTSVMRDRVDWAAVRAEANELRRGARTTADTYPAIRLVLQRLGDNHSHLASPETVRAHRAGASVTPGLIVIWPERVVAVVSPGGPADVVGVKVGDLVEAVNGSEPAHVATVVLLPRDLKAIDLTLRRAGEAAPRTVRLTPREAPFNQPATVRSLADGLGYIDLPGVVGGGGTFDEEAVAAIRTADARPRCGWVVDLRRNVGGNMWPMLHAVRPILGEAPGYFVSRRGRAEFSYRYGKGPGANAPAYQLKRPDPPVAVLTSRLTVSSGEALTIAFRGRPGTRSFGEPTAGLPTSNQSLPMVDGAVLVVTNALEADRTGRVYEGRIKADQDVEIDWTRLGSDDDPVLRAATAWLRNQPQCAAAGPE